MQAALDLGFDGPGDGVLTSCGPPLYGNYGSVPMRARLDGGPPEAQVFAVFGATNAPAFSTGVGAVLVLAGALRRQFGDRPEPRG